MIYPKIPTHLKNVTKVTLKTLVAVPQAGLISEKPLRKSYLWRSLIEVWPETSQVKQGNIWRAESCDLWSLFLVVCWFKMHEEPILLSARLKSFCCHLQQIINASNCSDQNRSACWEEKWYAMPELKNWRANLQPGIRNYLKTEL